MDTRFSTFESNQVLKASSVISPSTQPSDPAALARFGHDEIKLPQNHFAQPLEHCGYSPNACVDEWAELKMKVHEIYSQEPSLQYVNLWQ